MDEQMIEKKPSNWPIWIAVLLTIGWVAGVAYFPLKWEGEPLKPSEWGDYLAGAFAPLAFAWLAFAVFLQNADLALTREELKETRKVLKKQADQAEASTKYISKQTKVIERQHEIREAELVDDKFSNLMDNLLDVCLEMAANADLRTSIHPIGSIPHLEKLKRVKALKILCQKLEDLNQPEYDLAVKPLDRTFVIFFPEILKIITSLDEIKGKVTETYVVFLEGIGIFEAIKATLEFAEKYDFWKDAEQ